MSRSEMAAHRRFGVGMIFQSFNLIQSRNALENVELALAFGGLARNKRRDKATQLLEMVGLSERLKHRLMNFRVVKRNVLPSPVPWPTIRDCCWPMSLQVILTAKQQPI